MKFQNGDLVIVTEEVSKHYGEVGEVVKIDSFFNTQCVNVTIRVISGTNYVAPECWLTAYKKSRKHGLKIFVFSGRSKEEIETNAGVPAMGTTCVMYAHSLEDALRSLDEKNHHALFKSVAFDDRVVDIKKVYQPVGGMR